MTGSGDRTKTCQIDVLIEEHESVPGQRRDCPGLDRRTSVSVGATRSGRRTGGPDRRRACDRPGVVRFGEPAIRFDVKRYPSQHPRADHGSAPLSNGQQRDSRPCYRAHN